VRALASRRHRLSTTVGCRWPKGVGRSSLKLGLSFSQCQVFFVFGIWFLFFLSGKEVGWILSLHDVSDEDDVSEDDISNLFGMMTWTIRFPDGDIKAGVMLPLWNKFLWSLLCFVMATTKG
jgi:hypothetical protein